MIKSNGTTLTFTPGGGIEAAIGRLTAISELVCDAQLLDVTTLDAPDGCRTFIQGARDAGEVRLTGFHEKTDSGQRVLRTAYQSGTGGTAAITFPDGMRVRFPALVKSHTLGAAQVDGAVGFGCTLRVIGAVTVEEAP